MTIIAVKTGAAADTRRVELSDGSLFSFKVCYLPSVFFDDDHYTPGREISPGEEESFRFASSCLRGEKTALRLVSRAEQTSLGIIRKLQKAGYSSPCARAVLARLEELGIVDDSRYARLWLQARLAYKAEGPRRLLAALRHRGISRQEAEEALRTVLDSAGERALLEKFLKKKRLSGEEPGIANILRGEGFSPSLIQEYRENT
ncbi:MAG: RecX family transcriptional regulator [Treponema sp.]|jgi:regulatory protein|nr:RecX family transcriptional regulator [Treponema sp.]